MSNVVEMPRPEDPLAHLNPTQRAAVLHGDGPLLVVAGAGTGKTRVITERIRRLLESRPELTGENILGLTFTEKAAAEMKHRVISRVGERARSLTLATFHSFCYRILLEQNPALRMLDKYDHWILLRRNIRKLELNEFRRLAEPGKFLTDFVDFFSRCQDELVTPDDYAAYVEREAARFEQEKETLPEAERVEREQKIRELREVARVYRISEELIRSQNCLTYGSSLLQAVEQLRSNRALLELLRERYHYILVDEFQDTNIAQLEMLWLLAAERRNIFVVGDDDQAIYRFRGASFGSFQIFAKQFLGGPIDPKNPPREVVLLNQNYRSTQRILRVSGQVIAQNNPNRMLPDKHLVTQHPPGEKIALAEFATANEEAEWLAQEIERMHSEGHRWGEFAILYRMHTHRDKLVDALLRRAIPFVIRKLSILENRLVRDVFAYLRLVATPGDDVACARVLAVPAWGLEPEDLARLCERTGSHGKMTLWEAVRQAQSDPAFARVQKNLTELVAWVAELQRPANQMSASEFVAELIADLGLVLTPEDPDRPYLTRLETFIREWQVKSEAHGLRDLMGYLELFDEAGGEITLDDEPERDAVQLMTVHAAKGLEFDHVSVMRLVQGSFPVRPRDPVLEFPADLLKEEMPKGDFQVQEERRLFYVAMTRARKRLTLTTVLNKRSKPSIFLDDIQLAPQIARLDLKRATPKVELPAEANAGSAVSQELFGPADSASRAYSRIGAWARTYRPPVFEPLTLSATAIDSYTYCPLKFLLSHQWKLRGGPQAAMTFGSVMHTTIKYLVKAVKENGNVPFEEVAAVYNREWHGAGFLDDYQEEEYRKEGLEQLRAFHASYSQQPPQMLHQEKSFELPLPADVVVIGRMDQVNQLDDGDVEIVDYKTGRPKEEKDAKKSLQLRLYALASREVLEREPARLTFYNLTTNTSVSAAHDEKQLKRAREEVQEVADDIRAGNFPAKPGFACKSCDFVPVCPEHEHPITIRPLRPKS